MRLTNSHVSFLTTLVIGALLLSGCAANVAVPPAGTQATSTSAVFRQAAEGLQQDCDRIGGCACYMDGLQTTCALVFACLDAGFCEVARAPD